MIFREPNTPTSGSRKPPAALFLFPASANKFPARILREFDAGGIEFVEKSRPRLPGKRLKTSKVP
jgi:hypothetical protein